jgi:transposase, IS30 family
MGRCYGQLSLEERIEIYRLHAGGISQNQIALALGRAVSTISRELRRNSKPTKVWSGGYEPVRAQKLTERRRRWNCRYKLARQPDLRNRVSKSLAMGHSPEQIAGRLALKHGRVIISHESIYRFIYHRTAQKDYWYRLLPCHKKTRGRRRSGGSSASLIKHRRSITERPAAVDGRQAPGHWEADFMMFSRRGPGLMVLHERQSRFSMVYRPADRKAVPTARNIARQLGKLPLELRQTISFDNGNEFAEHHRFTIPWVSRPSSVILTARGKKAAWKTRSAAYDAGCPARRTSASSQRPISDGMFSASITLRANAWTSRHPPRHSLKSNQPLHFKRESIPRLRGV